MTELQFVIAVPFIVAGVLTGYAAWRGAPFVPTPWPAVGAALDLARLHLEDTLVDLGAGDGRVVAAAARRGARAIGYELSPFLWIAARLRLFFSRSGGVIRFADAFDADLSEATVLFLFWLPRTLPAIARRLRQHARPGTRVITYAFALPEWNTRETVKPPTCATLRLYIVP